MDQAHLHLLLNHFPIIGTIFSCITLLSGLLLKQPGITRAGLGLFVLTGLLAIPAYLTGQGAEEVLKSIGQNPEVFEEPHEKLGEIVVWTCSMIGLLALVALLIENRYGYIFKILSILILILGLTNGILLKKVGTSGGEIRHTEIRRPNAGDVLQPGQNLNTQEPDDDDD